MPWFAAVAPAVAGAAGSADAAGKSTAGQAGAMGPGGPQGASGMQGSPLMQALSQARSMQGGGMPGQQQPPTGLAPPGAGQQPMSIGDLLTRR